MSTDSKYELPILSEPAAWRYWHKFDSNKLACVIKRMDASLSGADEYIESALYSADQMYDYARPLAAEISRLTTSLAEHENTVDRLETEVARLIAELEEARKDAGRYRWMRDSPDADPGMLRWAHEWERKLIDSAIDAAMTKETPHGRNE